MVADVGEAQRPRLLDQQPEHAAAAGQVADRPPRSIVDAAGDEALQLLAVAVEHAERRVPRPGQLTGDLENPVEDDLGVEFGDEAAADIDQFPQPAFVESAAVLCGSLHCARPIGTHSQVQC